MLEPPNILITGINGVGKSTILNLLPGEIILELDDNFNEIFQKRIKVSDLARIKECVLKEVDLNDLFNNFNSYYNLLQEIDIVFLIVDSTKRNIEESKELLLKLKENILETDFYVVANFQDRKTISWSVDKIELFLNFKTFGFSAIQDDAEEKITNIFREILNIKFSEEKESRPPLSKKNYDSIWSDIEEARLLESKQEYNKAAEKFSNAALKLEKFTQENEDIKALSYLCKALQNLILGENSRSMKKLAQAEVLFNQANEHVSDVDLRNLIYANSIFCEILKLSIQFDEEKEAKIKNVSYSKIQNLMKNAIEFYNEGNFKTEADWVRTTLKKFEEY